MVNLLLGGFTNARGLSHSPFLLGLARRGSLLCMLLARAASNFWSSSICFLLSSVSWRILAARASASTLSPSLRAFSPLGSDETGLVFCVLGVKILHGLLQGDSGWLGPPLCPTDQRLNLVPWTTVFLNHVLHSFLVRFESLRGLVARLGGSAFSSQRRLERFEKRGYAGADCVAVRLGRPALPKRLSEVAD
jgi:hypothetical protein